MTQEKRDISRMRSMFWGSSSEHSCSGAGPLERAHVASFDQGSGNADDGDDGNGERVVCRLGIRKWLGHSSARISQ